MVKTPRSTTTLASRYVDIRDIGSSLSYVLARLEHERLIPAYKGILHPHHTEATLYDAETVLRLAFLTDYDIERIKTSDRVTRLKSQILNYRIKNLEYVVEIAKSEDPSNPNNLAEHAEFEIDDQNTYERYLGIIGESLLPNVIAIIKQEAKRTNGRGSIEDAVQLVRKEISIPFSQVYSLASEIIATYKRAEREIENIKQAHPEVEAATS